MRRLLLTAAVMAATPGLALACAVATRIEVRNETGQAIRAVFIDTASGPPADARRFNRLPPAGLPAGAATDLVMPSCIGTYDITAVLADGTEQRHPALDARRIRILTLR